MGTVTKRRSDEVTKERPILFSGPMVRAILDNCKSQTRRLITKENCTIQGGPAGPYWDRLKWEHAEFRRTSTLMDAIVGKENAPPDPHLRIPYVAEGDEHLGEDGYSWVRLRSRVDPGDRLWVREAWAIALGGVGTIPFERYLVRCPDEEGNDFGIGAIYKASPHPDYHQGGPWKPSIHMPRWASRITLEVTGVRFQRLQDISGPDAIGEGVRRVTKDDQVYKWCVFDKGDYSSTPWSEMPRDPISAFRSLWNSLNEKRGHGWDVNDWVIATEFKRIDATDG